jgi:hypothetical protein
MRHDTFPRETLESHVDSSDGLNRIAWKDLQSWAEQNLNPNTLVQAWDHAELFAAEKLCQSLPQNYTVSTSDKVILVSNLPPDATSRRAAMSFSSSPITTPTTVISPITSRMAKMLKPEASAFTIT